MTQANYDVAELRIVAKPATGVKCPRCWHYHHVQHTYQGLCDRCQWAIYHHYSWHASVPGIVEAINSDRARYGVNEILPLPPSCEPDPDAGLVPTYETLPKQLSEAYEFAAIASKRASGSYLCIRQKYVVILDPSDKTKSKVLVVNDLVEHPQEVRIYNGRPTSENHLRRVTLGQIAAMLTDMQIYHQYFSPSQR